MFMNEIITTNQTAVASLPDQNATLTEMYLRFIEYIQVKDVTAKGYCVSLRCFFSWLQSEQITHPTRSDIKAYIIWLATPHETRRNTGKDKPELITFSAGTQATYLRAVKMFFEWTEDENLYPNIAKHLKGAKVNNKQHKRDSFTKEEAEAILNSINRISEADKRDYAMFCLGFISGLRIIEIQRANVGNLETLAGKHVLYVHGKGHDEADAPVDLSAKTYEAIRDYLNTRAKGGKLAATSPLFCGTGNRNRGRLEEPTISKIFKDRLKAAGYDSHRLTAHSSRHTSASLMIESGASLKETQQQLRHQSPEITCIYIHDLQRSKQNYSQRIEDYIFGKEQTPAQQIEKAANDATKLSYTAQKILAKEFSELVNKYRDLERSEA